MEGKTFFSKCLKLVGNVFGMGLDKIDPKTGAVVASKAPALFKKLAGMAGGAGRFALIMFIFSSMFRKPIDAIIHKIFGKPYDKGAEEQKKKLEEEQNAIIPELGISQKELVEKMQNNPQAMQRLQKRIFGR